MWLCEVSEQLVSYPQQTVVTAFGNPGRDSGGEPHEGHGEANFQHLKRLKPQISQRLLPSNNNEENHFDLPNSQLSLLPTLHLWDLSNDFIAENEGT